MMRREGGTAGTGTGAEGEEEGADVLTQMIQTLLRDADMPPREVEGVKEEFCDGSFAPSPSHPIPNNINLLTPHSTTKQPSTASPAHP